MDLSYLLDSPALLFVTLIIAALGILWLYVTLGGKQEQPNLSTLYVPVPVASKAANNKKANKGKPKKQGDISPRAAPKSRETPSEAPPTSAPAKKQKTTTKEPRESTVKAPQGSKTSQGSKSKGRKGQSAPKPVVEEAGMEAMEGNEGEWQTQLSRQQKKQAALRQKQQTATSPPEPVAQESKGEEEGTKAATNSEKTSYSKGGRRGKNKKQREKETAKSSEPTKDTPATPVVEQTAAPSTSEESQDGKERVAPPPQANEGQTVTEVERALREAAESSSSPEHNTSEGEFAEVKYKKQKKSKRKDTATEKSSSPEISTKDHEDDWVEIIKK